MNITTLHTLTFDLCGSNNGAYVAACTMVELAAAKAGMTAEISQLPLDPSAASDTSRRCGRASICGSDLEALEVFANAVSTALKFMGAE